MTGEGGLIPAGLPRSPWWASPWAAAFVLAAFYAVMLLSVAGKSLTADETRHATAGVTYWRENDYRLNPGNGTLAQRVIALPLLTRQFRFPSLGTAAWHQGDELAVGDAWFNQLGNRTEAMLARGRAAAALFAVGLAALVWAVARRWFGPAGGLLALGLCVLNPTLLANGPLMTSDTACALFFFASTLAWCRLAERLSVERVVTSGLLMGALLVTKMSGVLIVPIVVVLAAGRIVEGSPLPCGRGAPLRLLGRGGMATAYAGVLMIQALLIGGVIWAAYGFRYAALVHGQPGVDHFSEPWEQVTDRPPPAAIFSELGLTPDQRRALDQRVAQAGISTQQWTWPAVEFISTLPRDVLTPAQGRALDALLQGPPRSLAMRLLWWTNEHHLLPEAYTYGLAFIRKVTAQRSAFFNGAYSVHGWPGFFPYTALVKTPLPFFGLLVLAAAAVAAGWTAGALATGHSWIRLARRSFYRAFPLGVLFIAYWAVAIGSSLNIGHRHLLPTYPPLFVFAGAAALWWRPARAGLAMAWGRGWATGLGLAAGLLTAADAADVAAQYPNYLAYFNGLAGGPNGAFRHLVDSSLDWGQDLPGVHRYLADHPQDGPFYLAYFGTGSPANYGITARSLNPMAAPLQVLAVPAAQGQSAVDALLREHPDFEAAAVVPQDDQFLVVLLQRPAALQLTPGTYLFSATMLQWGPWDPRYETEYQRLERTTRPLFSADEAERLTALRQRDPGEWMRDLNKFNLYRVSRLAVALRQRQPDATINGSILVYRVGADELARALSGPPPEVVTDPRIPP